MQNLQDSCFNFDFISLEAFSISCRNRKIYPYTFANVKSYCHLRGHIPLKPIYGLVCNWPVHKLQVCKVISIERVTQMTGQMAKKNHTCKCQKQLLHFQIDAISIFVIIVEMATNHKPIKSLYTKSVENLVKIGSQLLSAIQRCYIPSCQSKKTRQHVFFLSSKAM